MSRSGYFPSKTTSYANIFQIEKDERAASSALARTYNNTFTGEPKWQVISGGIKDVMQGDVLMDCHATG
jgi:hypothetical protein